MDNVRIHNDLFKALLFQLGKDSTSLWAMKLALYVISKVDFKGDDEELHVRLSLNELYNFLKLKGRNKFQIIQKAINKLETEKLLDQGPFLVTDQTIIDHKNDYLQVTIAPPFDFMCLLGVALSEKQ